MEQKRDIKFHFFIIVALVVHIYIASFIIMPYYFASYTNSSYVEQLFKDIISNSTELRDVVVNINPDDQEVMTNETLLSDVTSSAKGKITDRRGDTWLNNSLQFQQMRMQAAKLSDGSSSKIAPLIKSNRRSDFIISFYDEPKFIEKPVDKTEKDKNADADEKSDKTDAGEKSLSRDGIDWSAIPDKKGINLDNAIYYSNSDYFSFNTKKFSNFEYFRRMKQKIAGNWYPPMMANSLTTGYTPGHVRVKIMASEEVVTYFILNRNGDVQKVVLLESKGNKSLHDSCVDAIKHSKSFGPVPEDIKGDKIVIPFIFGYYVR